MKRFTSLTLLLLVFASLPSAIAVQYIAPSNTASQSIGATNLLFLDNTNHRIGVGNTAPNNTLDVSGAVSENGYLLSDSATDNLVLNGDFEMGTTTGWTAQDTPTIVQGNLSGNYSAQYTGSKTLLSNDFIPVDPTRDVLQLEGWFKKTTTGSPTPGILYFGYIAYNASYTVITSSPCGTYCYFAASGYTIPNDNLWHKFAATTTGEGTTAPNFPIGTRFVRVLGLINYGASANEVTQIDHITLKRLGTGPLYVGYDYTSTNNADLTQVGKITSPTTTTMVISPPGSGNLGIGVSPAQKLDVGGAIAISGTSIIDASRNIVNAGTGAFSGALTLTTALTVANGGTGVATTTAYGLIAGGTTATGAFQNTGAGSSGQILRSGGAAALPAWSTATYPATATSAGQILRADGTNWVASTATYPNTGGSAGNLLISDGTNYVSTGMSGDVTIASNGVTTVGSNTVALGGDTTGNYAAGDAEAGNALTGDSATAFFSSGTLGVAIGGTGASTLTQGSVVFAGGSGVYTQDNTNLFWDDTNNNLGIGTAVPAKALSVVRNDAVSTENIVIYNPNTAWDTEALIKAYSDTDVGGRVATAFGSYRGSSSTGDAGSGFIVKTGTRDSLTTKFIINNGGSVGISTTTPLVKLQITQAADTNYPTLGTTKGAFFIAGDTNLYGLYTGINTNDGNAWMQEMRNNAATAYNIILQPVGGNVGIGVTGPAQKLDVGGAIAISGTSIIDGSRNIVNAGTGAFSGTITSTSTGGILTATAATTAAKSMRIANTGGDWYFGVESNSAGSFFTGSDAYAGVLYGTTNFNLIVGGTDRLKADTSGNVVVTVG